MLDAGEIDALFSANVPQCVLDGSPNVARLFPDFEPLERDYHRRTGIFPIMHTVVIRRRLYQVHTMVPWMNALVERNDALFSTDWWPYGIAANRTTLDTYLRCHHEQGLSPRRRQIDDVFAPQFRNT